MRLWFSHSSEVPIYRQLVTQVVLAILSGDLRPGERLPSTRELARRFALHPNTGYRQMEREGWTERRRRSGVVCSPQAAIFEVPKGDPPGLLAILRARAAQACRVQGSNCGHCSAPMRNCQVPHGF